MSITNLDQTISCQTDPSKQGDCPEKGQKGILFHLLFIRNAQNHVNVGPKVYNK